MTFDFFVLPFFLGLIALLVMLITRYSRWIKGFEPADKELVRKGIFTRKSLSAAGEVFMESLLHRKMFRKNALLGYMHMSFALGWFLLIVCGNLESRIYSKVHINPPYYPIFLKFFVHDHRVLAHELFSIPGAFRILMDALLLLVLSGLLLALIKRASSNWFGLKKASKHTLLDKVAISTLWLIFPLRLLAESFTAAAYQGGSFLTNSFGNLLGSFLPAETLSYPAWWAYSLALGGFFVSLPYSRFMHIPTEVMLIFLRHYGVKPKTHFDSYSNFEIQSCPKCGVCIDACPVHIDSSHDGIPPAYFLRSLKLNEPDLHSTYDCLLCGKCQEYCPVGININSLRVSQRIRYAEELHGSFRYLKNPGSGPKARVAYFAGCMTHLTPTIKLSMERILTAAGVNYHFIDREGSVCCGRPLWMAGRESQARELIRHNKALIESTGCQTLVLSCPICLKIFREEYDMKIELLHHSQYILRLVEEGRIMVKKQDRKVVYHDPCELGRGSGIYDEPRRLIRKLARLVPAGEEKEMSICCGGSLGSTGSSGQQRDRVSDMALKSLTVNHPEKIITACPLCKKTFQKDAGVEVMDIGELVSGMMVKNESFVEEMIYQEENL